MSVGIWKKIERLISRHPKYSDYYYSHNCTSFPLPEEVKNEIASRHVLGKQSKELCWADEFNLQMAMDFDEMFGFLSMPEAFANAPRLLGVFNVMIDNDQRAFEAGCSNQERNKILHDCMSSCSQREQDVLTRFWDFFGEVCDRVRNNPEFGKEIQNLPKDHYKMMPGLYTQRIMQWACQLMGC